MADNRIVIVLPEDVAAATLEKIQAQLPGSARILASPGDQESLHSFGGLVAAAADLPQKVSEWWVAAQSDGIGPLAALVLTLVLFAAVYGVERLVASTVAGWVRTATSSVALGSARTRSALNWGLSLLLRLLLFYIGCRLLIAAVADAGATMYVLGLLALAAIMRFRIVVSVLELLTGSADPARRLVALADDEARHIVRWGARVMVGIAILGFLAAFVDQAVAADESGALFAIATYVLSAVLGIAFLLAVRQPVERLIRGSLTRGGASQSVTDRIARHWYLLYAAIFLLTALTKSLSRLSSDADMNAASNYSALIFILVPFAIAGLRAWRDGTVDAADPATARRRGLVIGVFALAEGVAILLAVVLVLFAWNIDPLAPEVDGAAQILPRLITAALIVVVGIALGRVASTFLDAWAPEEKVDPTTSDNEMGAGGRSRFETVYPVLRAAVMVMLWAVVLMLALAALGVEIMPLIAGAGIVGLAVGFGAQTLVKDVISGVFYLWEDAFRVGEFIVTDEGKGLVEKILLRSVRLRHPRGPIYTIPFGTLGTIQNHSRDWVKVKFTLDVAADEDLERVRKLIKKVGVALEQDPELDGKFIEPLKSQGAVAMAGPNYQVGVKFMCAPGEQFLIRRKAYAALQKALKEHGIELATPRISVNSPEEAVAAAASTITPQSSSTAAAV